MSKIWKTNPVRIESNRVARGKGGLEMREREKGREIE